MLGHTDKATINKRRPLTAGMRELLSMIAFPTAALRAEGLTQAESNRIGALCDRGYATWNIENRTFTITDAGRAALAEAPQ